jgi:AraC-like DNA-binding protein
MLPLEIERHYDATKMHPALRALGMSRQSRARPGFSPHRHDCYEICLITKGVVDWWAESKPYRLSSDSVYMVTPGMLHGSRGNVMQPCHLFWFQLNPQKLLDRNIAKELAAIKIRAWKGAHDLLPFFHAMIAEYRSSERDSPRVIQANLMLLISILLRQVERAKRHEPPNETFGKYLKVIAEQRSTTITVSQLAARCNLSRSRLHQLFVKHTGIGPKSYLLQEKLRHAAERLLQSKDSITDIAFEHCFSSSQHFATMFRKFFGVTPQVFRKQHYL